jgi:hypothetical protein
VRSPSDRFEPHRWQTVEESSSAAGDHRPYRELEFVDNDGGKQRLRDRDASLDPDIASGLLLEIPNEFDQPAVDHRRIGPIPVKGRRCRDILRDPLMNVANGSISLLGQNCAHSV